MVVLVTGANGQLGQAIKSISGKYPEIDFVFCSSSELDITNLENCQVVFDEFQPQFCINAAAYTAVDKAESEPAKAFDINANGAENLAITCKKFNTILIHISTDFVFDAYFSEGIAYYDRELRLPLKSNLGLTETDVPFPSGVYGLTKLQGEQAIQANWDKHFIIRTSWVYSQFGNNFMKTMLRLASERDRLSVVADQIGTPTYTYDLARLLVDMAESDKYGYYHATNEGGYISWYDFACEIFKQAGYTTKVNPVTTEEYGLSKAARPFNSRLDKSKLVENGFKPLPTWQDALARYLKEIEF